MKIIRDDKGRISEIIKDESDGNFNMETILKIITDEEISKEKEITLRTKEKCNFFMGCASIAAKAIVAGIDEYNRQQQNGGAYNGLNVSEEDDC